MAKEKKAVDVEVTLITGSRVQGAFHPAASVVRVPIADAAAMIGAGRACDMKDDDGIAKAKRNAAKAKAIAKPAPAVAGGVSGSAVKKMIEDATSAQAAQIAALEAKLAELSKGGGPA